MFKKILIANRGEIAVRVIRACREMGIKTVAVYSDTDRAALHVRMADEAYRLGPAPATESYLRSDLVLEAAEQAGAEAVHPGYGFLSENAGFATACADAGVKFIGPPAKAIEQMGSKTAARTLMQEAGVPVVPGTPGPVADADEALRVAEEIGFPVMLKASAGGGGKGMRLVSGADELKSALSQAQSEAASAFGDSAVYVEKAIVQPRHIEVQVLADEHGQVIHLAERECSLQRRHQKIVEEAPAPLLEGYPEVRERLTAAAVLAAKSVGYSNAGTIEFLMDAERNFYFLEMNTRLQVEHPVTELITGTDLVKEQIHVANGEKLRLSQDDIQPRGWAMECRIYAEDPLTNFFPSPGKITRLVRPSGPGVRVDSGAYPGWTVPIEYDPLIAKLSAWGSTRKEAVARLSAALQEYSIGGIRTTLGFFRAVLKDAEFVAGDIDTGFVGRFMERWDPATPPSGGLEEAALAVAAERFTNQQAKTAGGPSQPVSRWKTNSRADSLRRS